MGAVVTRMGAAGAAAEPPGKARQPRLIDGIAVIVDEEQRYPHFSAQVRLREQRRAAATGACYNYTVDRTRSPGKQDIPHSGNGLPKWITAEHLPAFSINVADIEPLKPRV